MHIKQAEQNEWIQEAALEKSKACANEASDNFTACVKATTERVNGANALLISAGLLVTAASLF